MLVRFTDIKGVTYWINPVHVKVIREKRKYTEILVMISGSMGGFAIKVNEPIDTAAEIINTAMPDMLGFIPDDDDGRIAAQQAAAAAAVSG